MIRLSEKLFEEYFEVATSHREDTMEFARKEISGKEWLSRLYHKPSRKFAKQLIQESGVKGVRRRLCRLLTIRHGHNEW